MNKFYQCFRSEIIKSRRTFALTGTLLLPTITTGLNFLTFVVNRNDFILSGTNLWMILAGNVFASFALLLLPMYVSIVGYSANHVEHQADAWKNLFALPIPKSTIYCSKLLFILLQTFFCISFLCGLTLLSGQVLSWLYPEMGFQNYDSNYLIIATFFKSYLACLGILAIQYVLSAHWNDFIKPIGAALLGLVIGLLLARWKYGYFSPYSLCVRMYDQFMKEDATVFTKEVISSFVWAILVFFFGYWLILKKSVK